MTDVGIALLVGVAAGAHAATWGMYKDAIYEGFTYTTYFRSFVVSACVAVTAELVVDFDMTQATSIVVLFGLTYVIERGLAEFYKTFLRDEDQSKYSIPMQLAVRGKVVARRSRRLLSGAAYVVAVVAIVLGIHLLQDAHVVDGWPAVLLIGSAGGWISAFGGAWKDAPVEGFSLFKFFRSPLVALAYAVLLASMTDDYVYVSMGALGYTVATLETYKTFFKPNVPRGKFAGKVIQFPQMLRARQWSIPLYAGIWVGVVTAFAIAFTEPRAGVI
jgi:hypothetical protein